MTLRRFLMLGVAAAAAPVCVAAAAGLGLGASADFGAGSAAVARCDGNGVTIAYSTSGGHVESVIVSGIADPGCEGANVSLQITSSAGTGIASGSSSVPADGDVLDNSVTVSVSPQPPAEDPAAVHVALVGP